MMKKVVLFISIGFWGLLANAQNGLEKIIVEKYYISNADDSAASVASGTILKPGSVTYRIFVDMLPGYKFASVYGNNNHEMVLETSTYFYNNAGGNTSPTYTFTQARSNTVMLDSWLSAGAACKGYFGIPKSMDDGVNTILNKDNILRNNDTAAGIPLTKQDGMIIAKKGQTVPLVNTLGLDSLPMFDAETKEVSGQRFGTFSGTWTVLGGTYGYDSLSNVVLIAQITTNGVFSFKLNIQLFKPDGTDELYVTDNPEGKEIAFPSLKGSKNPPKGNGSSTVSPVTEAEIVSLYPNPVNDYLNVDFPSQDLNSTYQLIDVLGNVIVSQKVEGKSERIATASLAKGIYFLVVSNGTETTTHKIIKN